MSDLIDKNSLLANCRKKLIAINEEVGIQRTDLWIIRLFGDIIREEPLINAVGLGVEYNTNDYTIMVTTNYEERKIDESHSKLLAKEQTFKVVKNE